MGWFTGKPKTVDATVTETQEVAVVNDSALRNAWVKGLTYSEATQYFRSMRESLRGANPYKMTGYAISDNNYSHGYLEEAYLSVEREWLGIDRSNLTPDEVEFLYMVAMVALPELIVSYKTMVIRMGGHSKALESKNYVFSGSGENWTPFLKKAYAQLGLIKERQAAISFQASIPKVTFKVPFSVSESKGKLRLAMASLQKSWDRASKMNLSAEDRFFVDQVAGQYFPDAWSMLESFTSSVSSSSDLVSEAEALFLEQLSLMQKRLDVIGNQEQKQSLHQMEAHVSFLREVSA